MSASAPNSSSVDWTPTLVARLRGGESDAGKLLTSLYRQPMIRFCWGYLGNLDDAEDAVQDIFVKVLKTDAFPDRFRAWLCRIARNHCLNLLRSRNRRRDAGALPSDSHLDAALTGPLSRLVRGEARSRIAHLVAALPPEQREVLRLRHGDGLSRAEIAEVLELPESVVKSRLYEGLKKLREHKSILESR